MVHGMGGNVLEFSQVIGHLQTSGKIYGLQAKGSDGRTAPLTHIKGMARYHLEGIKTVQPHGPYSLIGYSLGGLVALEIARLLSATGEKLALLVMIDSYPYTDQRGAWKRFCQVTTQVGYWISDMARPIFCGTPVSQRRRSERARFSDFVAWTRYRPQPYSGEIKFVRAADSNYPDPTRVWPPFASRLKLDVVPGDHQTVLSRYCQHLASLLDCYLGSAPQRY